MREWLKKLDEIDQDCILAWEKLLGIKFQSNEEYKAVDCLIDEMILEFATRTELLEEYPDILSNVEEAISKNSTEATLKEVIEYLESWDQEPTEGNIEKTLQKWIKICIPISGKKRISIHYLARLLTKPACRMKNRISKCSGR